jgi:hypothetical protein
MYLIYRQNEAGYEAVELILVNSDSNLRTKFPNALGLEWGLAMRDVDKT